MHNVPIRFHDLFPLIQEEIAKGNSFSFTAFGSSMSPFIVGGKDRVTLSPIQMPLKKNDVVFFRRKNGEFVLHRIVRILQDHSLILSGDHQISTECILPDQVIAVLTALERGGKMRKIDSVQTSAWCFFLPIRKFFLHIYLYFRRKFKL